MSLDLLAARMMRLLVNRTDTYALQLDSGGYLRVSEPLTTQVLEEHLGGRLTVGAYLIDPQTNRTKTLILDIDPEHVEDPNTTARELYHETSRRLHPDGVFLEASRWPDPSYHIWACFDPPIPAWAARWMGRKILEYAGLQTSEVEVFPKQDRVGSEGFGSLVKLPLGLHRAAGKWSILLDENLNPSPSELYRKRPLMIPEEELERIAPRTKVQTSTTHGFSRGGVRPCIRRAVRYDLTGSRGHMMRLAVAVEYLARGASEEEVAKLFKRQGNYNYEKSLNYVSHAKQRGYTPFTCSKIEELGYCLGPECPLQAEPMVRVEISGRTQQMEERGYKVSSLTLPLTEGLRRV